MKTRCVKTAMMGLALSAGAQLTALRWDNRLTGRTLELGGGAELEVEVDAACDRIWIEGWHIQRGQSEPVPADDEAGFRAVYHRPDYPDVAEQLKEASRWAPCTGLFNLTASADQGHWAWARTRVFLPESLRGEPLTLTLGGFGVGDFRETRVFLNGLLAGERRVEGRWFEPGTFEIRPEQPLYGQLRFGQVNILALQLGGAIARDQRMEELDADHAYHLAYPHCLMPPYFQHIAFGERPEKKLMFTVESVTAEDGGLRILLADAEAALRAELCYRPADDGRTLIKSTTLTNSGNRPVRLMQVRLGDYATGAEVSEGNMGFPVYADDAFFLSLDHPAGWAMGEAGRIQLRQFPGALLEPGQSFTCMNAVLGVAAAGGAREAFLNHLKPRMRRVRRGHNRPYAILEPFGCWPIPPGQSLEAELSEEVCLNCADWLRDFRDATGSTFDLVSVDFWQDPTADLVRFNHRFPEGFAKARAALTATGTRHGLWVDSSMFPSWQIGHNPLVKNCRIGNPSYAATPPANAEWGVSPICRAAEPIRSIFRSAFLHHLREEGARLLKFDNLVSTCHNGSHGHWPGVYSTEAIYNSVIDFFAALDAACPEAFIMLYWGYRSPWWLLHGDTEFECGLLIEAASPSPTPSLYARDGVALTLDQGTVFAADIPRLGKDSLGVWLSRWPWNSSIGTDRWREGIVMDLCRGSLLFQPWLGEDRLGEADLRDMGAFLRLLRDYPDCFAQPHLILGDPWRNEPYGYACSDGRRAFVAVNNFGWRDYAMAFDTPTTFGLAAGAGFRVYRHYPAPARLSGADSRTPVDCLRPFAVALYEVVADGETPAAGADWREAISRRRFAEPSGPVSLTVTEVDAADQTRGFTVSGMAPASQGGGTLAIAACVTRGGRAAPKGNIGSLLKATFTLNGATAEATPVLGDFTYPATWQAWRVAIPVGGAADFAVAASSRLAQDTDVSFQAWFVPRAET